MSFPLACRVHMVSTDQVRCLGLSDTNAFVEGGMTVIPVGAVKFWRAQSLFSFTTSKENLKVIILANHVH